MPILELSLSALLANKPEKIKQSKNKREREKERRRKAKELDFGAKNSDFARISRFYGTQVNQGESSQGPRTNLQG